MTTQKSDQTEEVTPQQIIQDLWVAQATQALVAGVELNGNHKDCPTIWYYFIKGTEYNENKRDLLLNPGRRCGNRASYGLCASFCL